MRAIALCAALVTLAATPATAQQKTFTIDMDFDSGTLNNVRHTPVANQLILGRTAVSQTRLVWVSNTDPNNRGGPAPQLLSPGWIVRLDTTPGPSLGKQTARFDAALLSINGQPTGAPTTGNNPGRVAVDTNGDVWIINRAYYESPPAAQGSLTKFSGNLAHCINRNNNGIIDTSHDANGDGIIDPYKTPGLGTPANEVEYYGQSDECILNTIRIGVPGDIPRAVAVDRNGKIWVATWNGHSVYRFNPNEPVSLEVARVFTSPGFPITGWFYSAATADDYIYFASNPNWASSGSTGQIIRVNINNISQADYLTCGGGVGTCGSVYGIVAIPGTHQAWAGGYSGMGVYKADFDAGTCTCISVPSTVTAVTYDLNGKIWASGYSSGNVYRINPVTNVIEATCATGGASPHGLSVDFDGFIWSVQDGPNYLVRFDPVNTAANCGRVAFAIDRGALPVPAGQNAYTYGPYLYSDFTGVQIDRQAPYTYVGSWDGTYDGGAVGIPWSKVTWNQEPQGAVPAQTTLTVAVRAADSIPALGASGYTGATSGAALSGVTGRYVQVRATLQGPGWVTPVLSDLRVEGPCAAPGETCCVTDANCNDGDACTTDSCPAAGAACVHTPVADCCNTVADCQDANPCTTDSCPAAGASCVHDPIAGCCLQNADCADGNACTADVCSGVGGTCTNTPIAGCCNTNGDCTSPSICDTVACTGTGGVCVVTPIVGCCTGDTGCDDQDPCTQDSCTVATGTCSHAQVAGCCRQNADCSTGVACMLDECTGPGGVCTSTPITGCCTTNDDCATSNPCRIGTCSGAGGTCVVATVPECCAVAADCDDGNPCTIDTCPTAGGACEHAAAAGCCLHDADCDDGDACTRDRCSFPGGACENAAIEHCCRTQDDCPAGTTCLDGLCVTGGTADGGGTDGAAGDGGTAGGAASGCGCRLTAPAGAPHLLAALLVLGALAGRRRRR